MGMDIFLIICIAILSVLLGYNIGRRHWEEALFPFVNENDRGYVARLFNVRGSVIGRDIRCTKK